MKITKEQFEDIIAVGEAKAAVEDKKISLLILHEKPNEDTDTETEKDNAGNEIKVTYRYLGFLFEFRPRPERVSRGFSETTYNESAFFDFFTIKRGDQDWDDPERSLELGYMDFLQRNPQDSEVLLQFNGQKYASWEPFAKVFGINELVMFGTKIPRALAVKLTRICEEEGETPSWRIRLLIQEYLTEKIKDRVRQVLFEG